MNKKPFKLKLDKLEVEQKYKELGTILKVAKYYKSNPCTMARFFRRNNINYKNKHKNTFNEEFFSVDSPESFYLAGFIAADGNISSKKNRINIELAEKDKDFLQKILILINYQGNLKFNIIKNSKRNKNWKDTISYKLIFSSQKTVSDLKRFNIVPNKTKIYDFPDWLINHKFINHFMRGYFDGDGHIGVRNNKKLRWHLAGNYSFLCKFQFILEKNCHIHHNKIVIRPDGLACLEYQGNVITTKICNFLYNNSTFHLDRKYNMYINWYNTNA